MLMLSNLLNLFTSSQLEWAISDINPVITHIQAIFQCSAKQIFMSNILLSVDRQVKSTAVAFDPTVVLILVRDSPKDGLLWEEVGKLELSHMDSWALNEIKSALWAL